jgi:hypothetical protein
MGNILLLIHGFWVLFMVSSVQEAIVGRLPVAADVHFVAADL